MGVAVLLKEVLAVAWQFSHRVSNQLDLEQVLEGEEWSESLQTLDLVAVQNEF